MSTQSGTAAGDVDFIEQHITTAMALAAQPPRETGGLPSASTMAAWTAVGDHMLVVGIEITEDTGTDENKFTEVLGINAHTPLLQLGRVPAGDLAEEISNMRINGARSNLGLRSKAKQMALWHGLRLGWCTVHLRRQSARRRRSRTRSSTSENLSY